METTVKEAKADVVVIEPVEFMKGLNKGQTLFELAESVEKVVAGIRETGKPGKVVMELIITPVQTNGEQVTVRAEVDGKVPKLPARETLYFTTRRNGLTRNDPNQAEMGI